MSSNIANRMGHHQSAGDALAHLDRMQEELNDLRASILNVPQAASPLMADPRSVRLTLNARRVREAVFGADLFADPAWDILLEAYACTLSQRRTSVTDLCHAARIPSTTALRWVGKLEQDGWLKRHGDPLDRRRSWVELTEKGVGAMQQIATAGPTGLPL